MECMPGCSRGATGATIEDVQDDAHELLLRTATCRLHGEVVVATRAGKLRDSLGRDGPLLASEAYGGAAAAANRIHHHRCDLVMQQRFIHSIR